MSEPITSARRARRRKRLVLRFFLTFGLVLLLLVLIAPYVAQSQPMLGWIVGAVAERQNVHAAVGEASFGWFSPLELRDVAVETPYGEPLLEVDRIRADRPWWQLGASGGRLGTFIIDEPQVTLVASPGGWNFQGIGPPAQDTKKPAAAPRREPELSAEVRQASLTLHRTGIAEPLIDVSGVDVTSHIRYSDGVRWLAVEPFQPLDHKRLTPEMCNNGLELAAPILANAAWAEGEVSLAIDEFRLPLDPRRVPDGGDPSQIEAPVAHASGRLELHSVTTGLKNPVLQAIAEKLASLMGGQMPTRVRLADQSVVEFELRDRRVHHQGLKFGLPELSPNLVLQSAGSVGFDRTLDLRVQVPIMLDMFSGPLAQRVSGKSINLVVKGTLDAPEVTLPPGENAWQQLTRILSDQPDEADGVVADDLAGLVQELLPQARDTAANIVEGLGGVVGRMRDRRAERRAARDGENLDRRDDEEFYEEPEVAGDPGAASGDALPPPPPDESAGSARDQDRKAEADDRAPARGPLRRLLDRRRERRES